MNKSLLSQTNPTTAQHENMKLDLSTNCQVTHPNPGETVWDRTAPSREVASKLAHEHWDVEALEGPTEGVYAVRTRGGYCANVGNVGRRLAILNRDTDGSRTLICY